MQFTLFSPQRALNFSASCLGDRGSRQSRRISLSLSEAPYLLHLRSKAGKQIRSQSHKCPLQRCRNPRASPGSPLAAMLQGHKGSFSTLEQGACSNSGRDARDRGVPVVGVGRRGMLSGPLQQVQLSPQSPPAVPQDCHGGGKETEQEAHPIDVIRGPLTRQPLGHPEGE